VIAPFGVGVKTIGTLNPTPFARLQVEPGEKLWDFLERIARPRGIVMGSDHLGNFLLIGECRRCRRSADRRAEYPALPMHHLGREHQIGISGAWADRGQRRAARVASQRTGRQGPRFGAAI
jgi:prophage tail gpP-like protein